MAGKALLSMARKIIGLVGQRGTGKTFSADYLVSEYGFTKFSLAQPLREAAQYAFGLTDYHIYQGKDIPFAHPIGVTVSNNTKLMEWYRDRTDLKELPIGDVAAQFIRPRDVIRYIGELAKEVDPSIWVRKVLEDSKDVDRVVIDDVRFLVEVEYLRPHGVTLVYLATDEKPDDHVSEVQSSLIAGDFCIEAVRDGERTPIHSLYCYLGQIVDLVLAEEMANG